MVAVAVAETLVAQFWLTIRGTIVSISGATVLYRAVIRSAPLFGAVCKRGVLFPIAATRERGIRGRTVSIMNDRRGVYTAGTTLQVDTSSSRERYARGR
jgi:hypothetical protein